MAQEFQTEQEFLRNYDPGDYPRPSVTADIVVLTLDPADRLSVLLIKRGGWPCKGMWALPGGFLTAGKESAEQAAHRELEEETGLSGVYLKQLCTFSDPERDPRTHVISVAYTALVPKGKLPGFRAGDDACDAALFAIHYDGKDLALSNRNVTLSGEGLAFDHEQIIKQAVDRLRGRISYEPDAFQLLEDKDRFTINDLKLVFEAVNGKDLDTPNFRKMFFRNYAHVGMVTALDETRKDKGRRPTALYKFTPERSVFS